jgi:hypothetical protein
MTDEEPRPPRLWRQLALPDDPADWFSESLPDCWQCADCGYQGSLLLLQAHIGLMPRGACYDSG